MNFRRGSRREDPEINLVPFIDVLLVILIFLMITTTYARFSELHINLPEAQGESAKEPPAQITVNVSEQGQYEVNDVVLGDVGVESIVRALQSAAGSEKDPVVVISPMPAAATSRWYGSWMRPSAPVIPASPS